MVFFETVFDVLLLRFALANGIFCFPKFDSYGPGGQILGFSPYKFAIFDFSPTFTGR